MEKVFERNGTRLLNKILKLLSFALIKLFGVEFLLYFCRSGMDILEYNILRGYLGGRYLLYRV